MDSINPVTFNARTWPRRPIKELQCEAESIPPIDVWSVLLPSLTEDVQLDKILHRRVYRPLQRERRIENANMYMTCNAWAWPRHVL